ncbi:hypothetical protein [Streptomyces decoyicus]
MTSPAPTKPSAGDAKHAAFAAWNLHSDSARYGVLLTPWAVETAADGAPMISARATGQRAELAMRQFASPRAAGSLSDPFASYEQHPQIDYSEPGRVVCTWRMDGVGVRLWATDIATAPAPTPLVMPARVAPLPSGRLPYRRSARTNTTKEN